MAETKDCKVECCADWTPEVKKINAPIFLAQARTQTQDFRFKPWKFCPWCGANRDDVDPPAPEGDSK